MSFYIRKASGEQERFDIKKFRRSLTRAGASAPLISTLIKEIKEQPDLRSTKEIYTFALERLHKKQPSAAARYNLKTALLELGPAGFPFEQFVGELFKQQKYTVELNQYVEGWCVGHEIDVIAAKRNEHYMIECKFHNRQRLKSDVKVPLYMKARFDDIKKAWEEEKEHSQDVHQGWIVTNTKFTSEAVQYATCVDIKLLSWNYPEKNSLAQLIDNLGVHPITALTSLNKQQKRKFIQKGFTLCRHARKNKNMLKQMGFSEHAANKLIAESEAVCKLK